MIPIIFILLLFSFDSFAQDQEITQEQRDSLSILLLDKFYGKTLSGASQEEKARIENVIKHVSSIEAYRSMMDLYSGQGDDTPSSAERKNISPTIIEEELDYPEEDISSSDLVDQIILASEVTYDSVSLKWTPRNPDVLRDGIVYGYGIQRVEVNDKGYMVLATSEVLPIEGPSLPWSDDQVQDLRENLIENNVVIDTSFFDFMQTGNYAKVKHPNIIFSKILSALENDGIRKKLGLSYTDKSMTDNQKYAYSIFIQRNKDILHTGFKEVSVPERPRPKPPTPATINLIETQDDAVVLHVDWSSSSDVAKYQIQRKPVNQEKWTTIAEIENETDSLVYDKNAAFETKLDYRILAVGINGLVSPASNVKTVTRSFNSALLTIGDIDILEMKSDKTVIISWEFDPPGIKLLESIPFTFTIFKSDNKGKLGVYDRVASDIRNWADEIVRSRGQIAYAVQVVYKNGMRGPVSDKVVFKP